MSDLSSVDVDLDAARVAFDSGIDAVQSAVESALHGINQQIELLEDVREKLELKREFVELEIDGLSDRAAQLQALALPTSVGAVSGLAHAAAAEVVYEDDVAEYADDAVYVDEDGNEVIEVIEYVDEDGNPVDEHGNPLDDADMLVEEVSLDDTGWSDLELPRTDRLVALVDFHGEITTAEAVEALAEVGDEVSTSTVSASLGNLARQGRIAKLDAGLFGPA
jgi:uncharacterized protein YsxB (DUF464 family)